MYDASWPMFSPIKTENLKKKPFPFSINLDFLGFALPCMKRSYDVLIEVLSRREELRVEKTGCSRYL
jgi:hypothetical protein